MEHVALKKMSREGSAQRSDLQRDMKFLLSCIALAWGVQVLDTFLSGWLDHWMGIVPRDLWGLRGVILSPFAHADFGHLGANTLPWFVLGALASAATPKSLARMSVVLVIVSGLGVWLLGRNGLTVGASGLVYAYFGYLLGTAWYGRKFRWIVVAVAALLMGGLIEGLTPREVSVSWEGHLIGTISGIWLSSRHHKSQKK